jgi:predicted outer membrane protein
MEVLRLYRAVGCTVGMSCLMAAIAWGQQADAQPGVVKPGQASGSDAVPAARPRNPQREQRVNDRRTRLREGRTTTSEQSGELNYAIAHCLLNGNESEVELAQIAADRATNDEVKAFAQQMIKDHGAMAEKLRQFVGSNEPQDRRSQIEQEINERCAAALRKELESKSGKEFDACYVGSQIGGHMHMQAALEVLADETSGDLQTIVKEAQPVVEKHFKHAKELMEKSDTRQARRDGKEDRS